MKLDFQEFLAEREALLAAAPIEAFSLEESATAIADREVATVVETFRGAGTLLVQPRCGVGKHEDMRALLVFLREFGEADILTLTIDSYTRLNLYEKAANTVELNGYPLIHHGWRAARELEAAVGVPLQVRHGSPDGRLLAEVAYRAGLSAFEGGGISYNLPYSKSVPLRRSLRHWQYVDRLTALVGQDRAVDRETFGPLTAVLTPPSISIAISVLEALLAAEQGVRAISIGYPETGCFYQDVAALSLIPQIVKEHVAQLGLGPVEVFTSLHQWMGVFPSETSHALALIANGVATAVAGGANKLINKTHLEAHGIPTKEANAFSIRFCRHFATMGATEYAAQQASELVEEERHWLAREVNELLDSVYQLGTDDLVESIASAFDQGLLDIPFSPSRAARGAVLPGRGADRSIRYVNSAGLPFSAATLAHNTDRLGGRMARDYQRVLDDIYLLAANCSTALLPN